LFLLTGLAAAVFALAFVFLKRRILQKQKLLASRYPKPGPGPWRAFVVTELLDEARLLLRAIWRVAELPFVFWSPIICLGLFVLMTGMLTVMVVYEYLETPVPPLTLIYSIWFSVLISAIFMLFPLGLGQVLMIFSMFARGHPAGYGWEGLTASWLGSVYASERPPIDAEKYDFFAPKEHDVESPGLWIIGYLRHSRPYGSPAVLREMAKWMKEQATRPSLHGWLKGTDVRDAATQNDHSAGQKGSP
jgi:hypothetical protein